MSRPQHLRTTISISRSSVVRWEGENAHANRRIWKIGAETHYPTPCMLLTANTEVPEFGIPLRRGLSMPRAYTRKYQKELEDILYFLFEYPELRHHLTSEESRWVEKRRQQLINWLWRQMGRKDDPPLLDENLSSWVTKSH